MEETKEAEPIFDYTECKTFDDYPQIYTTTTDTWENMETRMPDLQEDGEDIHRLPTEDIGLEEHNERQIKARNWKPEHIGNIPKEQLFYTGLRPLDFMRAFHDRHEDLEKIDGLIDIDAGNPYFSKMGLHKDHPNMVFTEDELEKVCYLRPGSQTWYADKLTSCFGCSLSEIPVEVVTSLQQIDIQKSMGRTSFRNYMRRVNKRWEKIKHKTLGPQKVIKKLTKKQQKKQDRCLKVLKGGIVRFD